MYCQKCGAENGEGASFCSSCGEKVGGIQVVEDQTNSKDRPTFYGPGVTQQIEKATNKKPVYKKWWFWVIAFFVLGGIFSSLNPNTENVTSTSNTPVEVILDAPRFARITVAELKEIIGEPDEIEPISATKTSGEGAGKKVQGSIYIYKDEGLSFNILEGSVVRMHYNDGFYAGSSEKRINYANEGALFSLFNIVPAGSMKKTADTGSVLRYQLVSDKIADFWVQDISKADKTFGFVYITYNLNYTY